MQFSEVSEKDLLTIWPDNGSFKKMNIDEEKEQYVSMYNAYRKLFSEFFIEFLNLKEYDDIFANSNLNFVKLKKQELDIYQYFVNPELKYLYLRNNLYIEHLNDDEKKYLQSKIINDDYSLDDKAREFIKNSFKRIIRERESPIDFDSKTIFGPDSVRYIADNNSLIIGFKFAEFNLNGQTDDDWDKNHKQQLLLIKDVFLRMIKEFDNSLDIKFSLISYGTHSTRPLNKK